MALQCEGSMSNLIYQKWLYLRKFDDIRERAKSNDLYELMMATALVRHLLLENYGLAHKANQETRLKFHFEVCVPKKEWGLEDPNTVFGWVGVDPDKSTMNPLEK